MQIDFKGRKALVTGSTAGIGFAIAHGLARSGASVFVNGRTEQRVSEALRGLRELLPDADFVGVAGDVSTPEGAAAIAARVTDVDILVNNAGTANPKDFFAQNDSDWLNLFQLNVMGGVRAARQYIPDMVERGWGRVVFLGSESGLHIPKEMIDYGMTKAAVFAVSRGLAELVAGSGVTVNSIVPGPTKSEILNNMMMASAEEQRITQDEAEQRFLQATRPTTLINRFATTEEVANMVIYACSEQASATTGAALRVDGGIVRSIG